MLNLLASGFDRLLGARGCMLTFHRVARTEDWASLPDRGFHLSEAYLDRLLSSLKAQGWDVVTISEALERAASPRNCGRFVNISIDDVYRDTVELAVPLFRRHGCPVTLFVTTGIPDATLVMWTVGLESILHERDRVMLDGRECDASAPALKQSLFREIFSQWEASGQPEARFARFCADNGFSPGELHARNAVSWEMLRDLLDDPLVEIGAHTLSHPRVAALTHEQAAHELGGSRQRLREELGIDVRHFAFPYGRQADCGPRDFAIAEQAGFTSASTTRKGLVRPGRRHDRYCLPRNTLNEMRGKPRITLASHLTGASGLAARVTGRT